MRIDSFRPQAEAVWQAVSTVRQGGVVLYPSDTIYGLGCDPFQESALEYLLKLKGRDKGKGLLFLSKDLSFINKVCSNIPKVFNELSDSFWPGPVTFLLEGRLGLSESLVGDRGKVAVRWPDQPFMQAWLDALGGPLISTSANLSGSPPAKSLRELRELFLGRVDLFLEDGEPNPKVEPSSIVDLTMNPPQLVREGERSHDVKRFLLELG